MKPSTIFTLLILMLALVPAWSGPAGAQTALGSAQLQIAGTRLVIDNPSQTVPFNTPTLVNQHLEGYDPALGTLPTDLRVLGDLRGPEVDGVLVLETVPNEPFRIPALRLEGDYTLSEVRLVQGETLLAYAEPQEATILVSQVLVTKVSSRALTLQEIRALGLALDEDSYSAYNLTFGIGVEGETVEYNMPLVRNAYGPNVRWAPLEQVVKLPTFGGATVRTNKMVILFEDRRYEFTKEIFQIEGSKES